jgi:hypothetical protein
MRHVFLSYARVDSAAADLVQTTLEHAGARVWRDTAEIWPGEDWRAKIRRAVTADALVFVALFSRASLALEKSRHHEELALAIGDLQQRPPQTPWLIPVLVDECEIPDLDIGAGRTLRSLKSVNMSGSDRTVQLSRLAESVIRLAGNCQPLTGARLPPTEPDHLPPLRRAPWRGLNRDRVLWTAFSAALGALVLISGIAQAIGSAPRQLHPAIGTISPAPHHHHPAVDITSPAASHPALHAAPSARHPVPHTVAVFSGSGIENTPRFTVPATWKLAWQYNCASFGQAGNFQVYEDGTSGRVNVNELGKGGHGATFGYSDAGSHYLEVNSECRWRLKIITS